MEEAEQNVPPTVNQLIATPQIINTIFTNGKFNLYVQQVTSAFLHVPAIHTYSGSLNTGIQTQLMNLLSNKKKSYCRIWKHPCNLFMGRRRRRITNMGIRLMWKTLPQTKNDNRGDAHHCLLNPNNNRK